MNIERTAGVDEAGRGALAGPVVSAAVVLGPETKIEGLTDSKKLNRATRERLATEIKKRCVCWSIGSSSVEEIDQLNILQSTMLSMKRAIESLSVRPSRVLIDGNRIPLINIPAQAIVKGDLHVAEISAASVLAKVTRDAIMFEYAARFPEYGFERHVGYGTALHLESLRNYGATPLHRTTFSPVRKAIDSRGQLN